MPSKWLAAFRATEDAPDLISDILAVSADGAKSPPVEAPDLTTGTIGAIGAGDERSEQAPDPLGVVSDCLEGRAALIEFGAGVPRRWAEGYAALSSMSAPTGFSPDRWRRIVDAAGRFIDRWADEAIRCGWCDLDLFGCNPDAPDRRFDAMGLVLLLDRAEVVSIDGHGADLIVNPQVAQQRYRRRPPPVGTVSLWDLRRDY